MRMPQKYGDGTSFHPIHRRGSEGGEHESYADRNSTDSIYSNKLAQPYQNDTIIFRQILGEFESHTSFYKRATTASENTITEIAI